MSVEKLKQNLTVEQFSDLKETCLAFGLDINDPAAVPLAMSNGILYEIKATFEAIKKQNEILILESKNAVEFSVQQASKQIDSSIAGKLIEAKDQLNRVISTEVSSSVKYEINKNAGAVTETLTKSSSFALERFENAATESATGMTDAAKKTEIAANNLHKLINRLTWRLTGIVVAIFLASQVVNYGTVKLLVPDVDKAKLELAEAQAAVAALGKKGGRTIVSECVDNEGKTRLCIEVAKNQNEKKNSPEFKGPFVDSKEKTTYVIPKGY